MSEKIKEAIEKLAEKVKSSEPQGALELSHALLYLTQALHNIEGK